MRATVIGWLDIRKKIQKPINTRSDTQTVKRQSGPLGAKGGGNPNCKTNKQMHLIAAKPSSNTRKKRVLSRCKPRGDGTVAAVLCGFLAGWRNRHSFLSLFNKSNLFHTSMTPTDAHTPARALSREFKLRTDV